MIGLAVFAQLSAGYPYNLQWAAPSPLSAPCRGSGPYLIHRSLGSPVPQPKRHLNRFNRFFQGSLLWQTDRQAALLGL